MPLMYEKGKREKTQRRNSKSILISVILFSSFLQSVASLESNIDNEESGEEEKQSSGGIEKGIIYSKDFWFPGKQKGDLTIDEYERPTGWPSVEKKWNERSIFISMASYRDPSCSSTLNDLFLKASFPQRLFVGIYQQNTEAEKDCLSELSRKTLSFLGNIQMLRIDASKADGPTNARYWCSKLYGGQDYFMQIDSHTRFLEDWDQLQIEMWENYTRRFPLDNRKIVITGYPMSYNVSTDEYPDQYKEWTPCMCDGKFTSGLLIPGGTIVPVGTVYEIPFIAAGWMFGPGRMLQHVPFDNSLPHLFIGEELMHSVRLWAHGYRMYNPSLGILAHYYMRLNQPKVWNDVNSFWDKGELSKAKVKRALLFSNDSGSFPRYYPPKHLVQQYYDRFGIDVQSQTIKRIC